MELTARALAKKTGAVFAESSGCYSHGRRGITACPAVCRVCRASAACAQTAQHRLMSVVRRIRGKHAPRP